CHGRGSAAGRSTRTVASRLKVAFVTPELQALVRRTNLAGVSQDLAKHLRAAGSDTRVFLPWTVDVEYGHLADLHEVASVRVREYGSRKQSFEIHEGRLDALPVYLFDHPKLFRDRHPYGDESGPYPDNWLRYALLARAVLESFPALGFEPDVLHCMDWTTGLVPLYHQIEYLQPGLDHPASRAGTFFSIHNLAMQGAFEREILPKIGIPHRHFRSIEGVEHQGKVNYLKAGAEFATIIGTHSPTHAETIQQQDRGYGLEDTFERRKKELVGIHNGIDYETWDPTTDKLLPANFSANDKDLAGKRRCKMALQSGLGLDNGPRTLLACHVGRWDADSGFDLLAEVIAPILERNVELVVMGAGGEDIRKRLRTLEGTFMGRMRVIEGYDSAAAHRLMAGADALLLPSHYQPSNPLAAVALRYGVVPIVYGQSGLEQALPDALDQPKQGLAVHFAPYTGDGLLDGVLRAGQAYKDAAAWKTLVRRCLKQDFSWESTAAEYLKAYRRVTRRIRGR
ncbi:MAG TPA: glycogen/starch synthase, partial [Planctomycetota bacterium]|nr:glycogen/starch synthase [Planctomycetota bacterium]